MQLRLKNGYTAEIGSYGETQALYTGPRDGFWELWDELTNENLSGAAFVGDDGEDERELPPSKRGDTLTVTDGGIEVRLYRLTEAEARLDALEAEVATHDAAIGDLGEAVAAASGEDGAEAGEDDAEGKEA